MWVHTSKNYFGWEPLPCFNKHDLTKGDLYLWLLQSSLLGLLINLEQINFFTVLPAVDQHHRFHSSQLTLYNLILVIFTPKKKSLESCGPMQIYIEALVKIVGACGMYHNNQVKCMVRIWYYCLNQCLGATSLCIVYFFPPRTCPDPRFAVIHKLLQEYVTHS